ncbi:satratoxin biosynthesis SC1 cluster protein 4 [Apiospora phragmitis]|uniref:Satratoxin biosynthesis SC1 cluster protein 4 n=1 Tax=Apiospora phragmitis TaxID=2905665 RepID=A0ABR1VCP0_9PEZI
MGAVTVGLALRLGTRITVDRKLAWEDGLVLLSWLAHIALGTIVIVETRYGLGKHWDTFDVTHIDVYLKLITISSVTYTFAIITAEASLAALYLTVFRGRSCLLHTLNQCLLLFLVCEAIEETAVVTSQCLPTIGAWSSTGPGACVNLKPFWWTTRHILKLSQFACYMATNILLFFQPLPFLWYKDDYAMPYIWSEIDVCVILLFSCGLSVRDILHSSKAAPRSPTTATTTTFALKWPSCLAHFRLPGRAESQPRDTVSSPSDAFRERMAWIELLNTHTPYVLPGSSGHPQLGSQIRIEATPAHR